MMLGDISDTGNYLTSSYIISIIVSSCCYGLDKYITYLCSFDFFCRLLEKDSFIKNMYIALSCPIK